VQKIAIVGASIAGRAAAIMLDRLGCDVTVYDKLKPDAALLERGAGIVLPNEVVQELIQQKIIDTHFPCFNLKERPIYIYDKKNNQEKLLTIHPLSGFSTHWANLYTALQQQYPEEKVIYDANITSIEKKEKIELTINQKQTAQFDYCIGADGYHSLIRQKLFSGLHPRFANYIAWRGVVDRVDQETTNKLLGKVLFYVYEKGHLLIYLVPKLNAENLRNEYRINWLLYEKIDSSHELFQNDLEKAKVNIMPGVMPKEYEQYLWQLAKNYFPPFAKEILLATKEPFLQAIYDLMLPQYYKNNIAVVGDASTLLRPHVGSGSTKALQNALVLAKCLQEYSNIDLAFQSWSEQQSAASKKLYELGVAVGDLFVSKMPDWNKINKQQIDEIWNAVVSGKDWYMVSKQGK